MRNCNNSTAGRQGAVARAMRELESAGKPYTCVDVQKNVYFDMKYPEIVAVVRRLVKDGSVKAVHLSMPRAGRRPTSARKFDETQHPTEPRKGDYAGRYAATRLALIKRMYRDRQADKETKS